MNCAHRIGRQLAFQRRHARKRECGAGLNGRRRAGHDLHRARARRGGAGRRVDGRVGRRNDHQARLDDERTAALQHRRRIDRCHAYR